MLYLPGWAIVPLLNTPMPKQLSVKSVSIISSLFLAISECPCVGGEEQCPIGSCECQGQLRVAHDCHDARWNFEELNAVLVGSTNVSTGSATVQTSTFTRIFIVMREK